MALTVMNCVLMACLAKIVRKNASVRTEPSVRLKVDAATALQVFFLTLRNNNRVQMQNSLVIKYITVFAVVCLKIFYDFPNQLF